MTQNKKEQERSQETITKTGEERRTGKRGVHCRPTGFMRNGKFSYYHQSGSCQRQAMGLVEMGEERQKT